MSKGKQIYLRNREIELLWHLVTQSKTTELGWEFEKEVNSLETKLFCFEPSEIKELEDDE